MDSKLSTEQALVAAHGFCVRGNRLLADPCLSGGVPVSFRVQPESLTADIARLARRFPLRRTAFRLSLRLGVQRSRLAAWRIESAVWRLAMELLFAQDDAHAAEDAA